MKKSLDDRLWKSSNAFKLAFKKQFFSLDDMGLPVLNIKGFTALVIIVLIMWAIVG